MGFDSLLIIEALKGVANFVCIALIFDKTSAHKKKSAEKELVGVLNELLDLHILKKLGDADRYEVKEYFVSV